MSLPSFLFCPFYFLQFFKWGKQKNEMRRETTSEWVTRAMKNISQNRIWAFRNSTKKLNFLLLKKKGERKEESMRTSPLAPFYSLLPFSLEKGLMDCNRLTDGYVHKKAPHTHTHTFLFSLYSACPYSRSRSLSVKHTRTQWGRRDTPMTGKAT